MAVLLLMVCAILGGVLGSFKNRPVLGVGLGALVGLVAFVVGFLLVPPA